MLATDLAIRPWQPIAEGALRERAFAALDRIAQALDEPARAWLPSGAPETEQAAADLSLAGGCSGQAVLHAYLHPVLATGGHLARAANCLDLAVSGSERTELAASLFSGFVGIAWALEHVGSRVFEADGGDPLEAVDRALRDSVEKGGGPTHFDLVTGWVGIGVYALERLPRPDAAEILSAVLARLARSAELTTDGLAWRSPPEALVQPGFQLGPFDLGLAHGMPGVIALLSRAIEQGGRDGTTRATLEGALEWLLAQRLGSDELATFSNSAGPGSTGAPSRLAWCYGDLGIASALLAAARALDRAALADEALAIARRAAARDPAQSGVRDAPLCHGAAGVAHTFNRLYQASGDEVLLGAARSWLARALDAQGSEGIGGYRAWAPREADGAWIDDPGLLSGSAGIALALAAAVSNVEPAWDRMLLLSAPPAARRA